MNLSVQQDTLTRELETLAGFNSCSAAPDPALPQPQRAVTRVVFTGPDLRARAWLKQLATDAGFHVREDAVGNTFIRWQGTDPELPAVATGSHMDAIPHAGMYDGTVGVLGGLEAMRALKRSGFAPRRSLELILFTSEEPTRFGIGCLGSRLLSGALAPELADALPDRSDDDSNTPPGAQRTLRSARTAAGFTGPLASVRLAPGHYAAFLELHIEQGPLLDAYGDSLGLVTHIAGPASLRYTVRGLGGHAGALLMPDRRDALCAAAELVLALEHLTLEANDDAGRNDTVATVGRLEIHPNTVNAVPSEVAFTVDLRSVDLAARDTVLRRFRETVTALAQRRGVQITESLINADPPTACDPACLRALEAAAAHAGVRAQPMVSRAYHDTLFMALVAPVAMLFIPCRGGVSHRPDEYASPEAITLGVSVLAHALAALAGGTPPAPATPEHG